MLFPVQQTGFRIQILIAALIPTHRLYDLQRFVSSGFTDILRILSGCFNDVGKASAGVDPTSGYRQVVPLIGDGVIDLIAVG